MPVSKRRKPAVKKRFPKPLPRPVPLGQKEQWTNKLHSSRLYELKDDPDFLAMIKVGRAMNAITYTINDILDYREQATTKQRLQYRRATLVLGGYVHEAVTVVDRIKGRYLGMPEFEGLRVLVVEAEHRKVRRYAKTMRNCLAFHLDESDVTTHRTLSSLKPANYTIMDCDKTEIGGLYFEFSDYLDLAFLVHEFADGREWEETTEDIFHGIMDYAVQFMGACHDFMLMLWKTKIAKHVY